MTAKSTLVLIDHHSIVPFIVRSHQYLSRAAAFQIEAGDLVDVKIWLPKPEVGLEALRRQIGMDVPEGLVTFGPQRERRILGKELALTFLFRAWIKRSLLELKKTSRPIVYLRTLKLAHALIPFLKEQGIPYIFETHEIFHLTSTKKEVFKIEEAVYRNAAMLIPISKPLADDLSSLFGVEVPVILPSGHNDALKDMVPYDASAPPRFLYVGSLHRWKGLEPFLLATKSLAVPTDVVGDAGGIDRLMTFAAEHHLDHVIFHGQQKPEEVVKFYTPSTICVLPLSESTIAQRYTSPLKLFEYASAGRPVIVGEYPSITTIPEVAENVRLVGSDWQEACAALLDDPEERARLAAGAKSFAGRYTWRRIARVLVESAEFQRLVDGE